jgi:hypothetical protein
MKSFASLAVLGLILSGSQAFAHKAGPCASYWKTSDCKAAKGHHAKMECVKAAATAANDTACTDSMAAHHGKHHMDAMTPATTTNTTPTTTAPAAPATH